MTRWVKNRTTNSILKFLAVIVALSFILSGYTVVRQSQSDAARRADRQAAATSQVSRCFQSVKDLPKFLQAFDLITFIATDLIDSKENAILAQPDNPLNESRQESIDRLKTARDTTKAFTDRIRKATPTNASCQRLAQKLGVDASRVKGTG